MAIDQKITELPVASAIGSGDACLLVSNGNDYQFAMSLLLQYVSSNLSTGATISFGTSLPQNNSGKNGDVFINTFTGTMAQKSAGAWIITYTPAVVTSSTESTILYGLGLPTNLMGSDGDSYINTATGIFYKKNTGVWNQVFSMQSGPAGPQGIKGDTGPAGINGNTLLSGNINPSNQSTGKEGDFYLNTNTYNLFGPKTNGVWGAGIELIQSPPEPVIINFPAGTPAPILLDNYQSLYSLYGNYPTLLIYERIDAVTTKERADIQPTRTYFSNQLTAINIDVPADDQGKTINYLQLIIKA